MSVVIQFLIIKNYKTVLKILSSPASVLLQHLDPAPPLYAALLSLQHSEGRGPCGRRHAGPLSLCWRSGRAALLFY